jgi:pimeloyl-ACP methyl ester carboxylesterase
VSSEFTLRDGRTLGYREYGDRNGAPVLFFPDIGQSSLARHPNAERTAEAGVRLIAVDRPGIGASSRARDHRLLAWSDDMRQLADALGLPRFGVLGWGWGAAYALACAQALPDRIDGTGLVGALGSPAASAPLGPEIRALSGVLRYPAPAARWALRRRRAAVMRHPRGVLERMPAADRDVLHNPAITAMLDDSIAEAWRSGIDGIHDDLRTAGRDWGFQVEEIRRPVYLWYGEGDSEFPPEMERSLAERLPRCRAVPFRDEGHLVLFTHWDEIMGTMAAAGM